MKVKNLLVLPILFIFTSCENRLLETLAPSNFKDEDIKNEVNMSESEKSEVRSSVHNFVSHNYIYTGSNVDEIPASEYYSRLSGGEATLTLYVSTDDNFIEFETMGYRGRVDKDGDEYTTSGTYFDFVGSYVTEDFVKSMYEQYNSEMIYSFGVMTAIYQTYSQDMSVGGYSIEYNSKDSEWYKKMVCTENKGGGDLTIGLNGTITVGMTMKNQSSGDVVSTTEADMNYVELKFENHLLQYCLVYEKVYNISDGERKTATSALSLSTYEYNVNYDDAF